MKKFKNLKGLGLIVLVIALTLFIIVATVMFQIFEIEILPAQFAGAIIGVVITVIITAVLLKGQSLSEEQKEKNVKVFEEKTKRYNIFIDELWSVWDDRTVTLEEIYRLLSILSKDIILYTKKETVSDILDQLHTLSKQKNSFFEENEKNIQKAIYNIINLLAKELNLGGEIDDNILKKINRLEEEIVPLIESKRLNERFFKIYNNCLKEKDFEYCNAYPDMMGEEVYIFIELSNSPIYIMIGPIERKQENNNTFISFFVEYDKPNTFFNEYREASKGPKKEYLTGRQGIHIENFKDYSKTKQMLEELNEKENFATKLAYETIDFYHHWKTKDNKDINQLISDFNEL